MIFHIIISKTFKKTMILLLFFYIFSLFSFFAPFPRPPAPPFSGAWPARPCAPAHQPGPPCQHGSAQLEFYLPSPIEVVCIFRIVRTISVA